MAGAARAADTALMETACIDARATPLKVFLADDHAPLRERIAALLRAVDGVRIVGEADTPAAVTSGILSSEPHVVVLDLQLTGGTGLEVLRAVHGSRPDIVFIVLTNHASTPYRRTCLACGASHFLDKSLDFDEVPRIVAGLRSSFAGSSDRISNQ